MLACSHPPSNPPNQTWGSKYLQLIIIPGRALQLLDQLRRVLKARSQGFALLGVRDSSIVATGQDSLDGGAKGIGVDGSGELLHLGGVLLLVLGGRKGGSEGRDGHLGSSLLELVWVFEGREER
jgi:hypothetical protein